MTPVLVIAAKEFRDALRNRWVVASVLLFAGTALALALVGSAPVGTIKATSLGVTTVSLASLSVYLVPLIALMLAYDAVVGEVERGTLLLLLSHPVRRWHVLLGKFLGHTAILTLALSVGYGSAGLLAAAGTGVTARDVSALMALILSSILLGAAFVALGYLISVSVAERATAIGLAVGLWLAIVILYDLALVGVLLADTKQLVGKDILTTAMLLNPADAFRVFNLSGFEAARDVALFGGLGEADGTLATPAILAMVGWLLAAGAIAFARFRSREF
jgi:Cu-processing system permease protein